MNRSFVLVLLMSFALAGCDDGTKSSSTIATSDLTMSINATLTNTNLQILVDVDTPTTKLRVSSGDQLVAYINGSSHRFEEHYHTYPYAPADKHYYYMLTLPANGSGTEVRVALERRNAVSATDNIVTVPAVPEITSPQENSTLNSTQDNYFTWMPSAAASDSLQLVLEYCCIDYSFSLDVDATQHMIPAGAMYNHSVAVPLQMTLIRSKGGAIDGKLKGGYIHARSMNSRTLWLQN